jgi:hypothetical protein
LRILDRSIGTWNPLQDVTATKANAMRISMELADSKKFTLLDVKHVLTSTRLMVNPSLPLSVALFGR